MKTYIVNLEKSIDRKAYMLELLEKHSYLDFEFVAAVDGREMSIEEQFERFDIAGFSKKYAKEVRPGEIGCTLSHQKCYRKLLNSGEKSVLILEDDVIFDERIQQIMGKIEMILDSKEPQVVLLSGWFWFYCSSSFGTKYRLANVLDAFLTHAYVINNSAAELLIESRPCILADDWRYIRQKGVTLKAVLPHLVDQAWDDRFNSVVNVGDCEMTKRSFCYDTRMFIRSFCLKSLALFGGFESAEFKK